MKNLKIFFIVIVILIIIISLLLVLVKKQGANNKKESNSEDEISITDTVTPTEFVRGDFYEPAEQDYYCVSIYATKFLNAIANESSQEAYSMLDEQYRNKNDLNTNNIIAKLKYSSNLQEFETTILYKLNLTEMITAYAVTGKVREDRMNGNLPNSLCMILYVDNSNKAFSIVPLKEEININTFNINELNTSRIIQNSFNEYKTEILTKDNKAKKIFAKYIVDAVYYPEEAYNSLDNEYRMKRFGTLEDYKQYVEENREYIINLKMKNYTSINNGGNIEYKIQDQYDNVYTFNIAKYLTYTAVLDEYTIPSEQYISKYNQATIEEKLGLNVLSFISMLNNRDYKSAYNCLSEGFKQNYFPTLDDFKNYAKANFFEANELTGVKIDSEGDVFMITVDITDYTKQNTATIRKTFIMQLGNGTDFVMSFNVE